MRLLVFLRMALCFFNFTVVFKSFIRCSYKPCYQMGRDRRCEPEKKEHQKKLKACEIDTVYHDSPDYDASKRKGIPAACKVHAVQGILKPEHTEYLYQKEYDSEGDEQYTHYKP